RKMLNVRFAHIRRPAQNQDVETTDWVAKSVTMQEMPGRVCHPPLFFGGDRLCRSLGGSVGRRSDLAKNQATPGRRDQGEVTAGTEVIVSQTRAAKPLQVTSRGAFGAIAEPASPPWPAAQSQEWHVGSLRGRFPLLGARGAVGGGGGFALVGFRRPLAQTSRL